MPEPKFNKGDNPKANLAQTLDALDEANDRLAGGRAWYEMVRQGYEVKP